MKHERRTFLVHVHAGVPGAIVRELGSERLTRLPDRAALGPAIDRWLAEGCSAEAGGGGSAAREVSSTAARQATPARPAAYGREAGR